MAIVFEPLPNPKLVLGSTKQFWLVFGVLVALQSDCEKRSVWVQPAVVDLHRREREELCPVEMKSLSAF